MNGERAKFRGLEDYINTTFMYEAYILLVTIIMCTMARRPGFWRTSNNCNGSFVVEVLKFAYEGEEIQEKS